MRFKIDWASLIVGRKFTVFALYLRAISKYKPPGEAYVCRGDVTEGLLRYECGGLIFGGAYFWNFMVSLAICKDQVISNQNLSYLFIKMS